MTATPPIADRDSFEAELAALRVREKALTREKDAIAAARRRLPMVEVDPATPLDGPDGPVTLHLLDQTPRRRGDGLQLRAHGPDRVRTPGELGGLTPRLAPGTYQRAYGRRPARLATRAGVAGRTPDRAVGQDQGRVLPRTVSEYPTWWDAGGADGSASRSSSWVTARRASSPLSGAIVVSAGNT